MKKLVLLFIIGSFILAGCSEKPDSEQDCEIIVCFTVDSQPISLLKSTATTAEERIDRIILYGAAGSNVTKLYDGAKPSTGGIPLIIPRTISTLYAIANPSTSMETATTVTVLTNLTGSFTSAPASPFLMSGIAENIDGKTNKNISINLVRAVAKIEFTGTNGFVITSVTVQNTPTQGYVFQRSPFAVPTTTGNYAAINSSTPVLYVAENTSSTTNPPLTNFRVNGRLNSGTATNYDINLKKNGQNIDIVRNTRYQVSITPITEDECIITVNIPGWSDVTTDDYVIN